MLFPYSQKNFSEQFNEFIVDDYGIIIMEKFAETITDANIKITTHGAVQFMSWVQYWKVL